MTPETTPDARRATTPARRRGVGNLGQERARDPRPGPVDRRIRRHAFVGHGRHFAPSGFDV